MTTISTTTTSTSNLLAILFGSASAARSASGAGPAGSSADTGAASGGATSVSLSDAATALMQQASQNQATALNLPASFDDLVQQKTDAFAASLTAELAGANIPTGDPITLQIDSAGTIHADGPYKDKIEKLFKDDPALAEQAKEVATLNALRATTEALRLYNKELRSAHTKEQRTAASDRYMVRSMTIQALSGTMTLAGGKITSAAMAYADALSPTD